MGTACYVERKYDTSDADLDYGLCLTGMPIYDKVNKKKILIEFLSVSSLVIS